MSHPQSQHTRRLDYIDVAKMFAILCVLVGHLVQWMFVGDIDHEGTLYCFIYSFHMPLFLTLSGYFMHKSFEMPFVQFLVRRARQLLLPVLSFGTLFWLFHTFIYRRFLCTGATPLPFTEAIFGGDMWFLKYLFLGMLTSVVFMRIFRRPLLAAVIPTALLIVCFRLGAFRVLPYLWLGYCLHRYAGWLRSHCAAVTALSGTFFALLLCYWDGTLDYTYGIVSFHDGAVQFSPTNLLITLYRLAVGISGSVFFIGLFDLACRVLPHAITTFMASIGRNTLGIYCLQIYLLEFALRHLPCRSASPWAWAFEWALGIAYLLVLHLVVLAMRRSRLISRLFLGQ